VAEDQVDENPTAEENLEASGAEEARAEDQQDNEGDSNSQTESDIETLQGQLSEARDQVLRAQAEAQNALRRAERDVEKAHKFGQEKLIGELLVVVDNLERSLSATEGQEVSLESIKEGVELTLKSLLDALKRHNVEQIDPEGQPFDPALHQAMTMVPSPDQEPNSVINVFQKGYTLHGRLVRPAMVVVSKAPD